MNLSTVLIGLAVLAVFAAIVAGEVKKRKSGGCSCGCGGCPNASVCGRSSGAGDAPDSR